MFSTFRKKWLVSIILAGFLLILTLAGGKWGTSYSAGAGVNLTPIIDSIDPSVIPAGSPDTIIIINGSNFGNTSDTSVRLHNDNIDITIIPQEVIPDRITVSISETLLAEPTVYTLTVLWSDFSTIPTIPITPHDQESNPLPLVVYTAQYSYLPIIGREAK